jgi:NAD+ synthase (glutamine-hydrolysing)
MYQWRHRMVATRATDELSYVCYLNTVGGQDELVFEGGSFICDQDGNLVVQGPFFEEEFLVADLDIDAVFSARLHDGRRRQTRIPISLDERSASGHMVETPLAVPRDGVVRRPLSPQHSEVPEGPAEVYGALVLGTRDYVRKNGAEQVYIALSGGIDSSLVAAIAVDALGPDAVMGVLMPSRYSSEGSMTDAELLAWKLGIRTMIVPIEEAFSAYLHMLAGDFEYMQPDITEENIQARIRGNIVMALSNKFGGIVLTTGNKSELAVGYTTLYGDLAGGFAVIKDVFKTTVFELARYKNESAGKEIIPQTIIAKEPSAELRPGQRDVDSLPPYPVLDSILTLYVEEDRSSTDIVARGYDPETVTRVVNLVDHSEYKRRQAPPGVKISVRAFGKDRRLPITDTYRDLPEIGSPHRVDQVAEALREREV